MSSLNSLTRKRTFLLAESDYSLGGRRSTVHLTGNINKNDWDCALIPQPLSFEWGKDTIATENVMYAGTHYTASYSQRFSQVTSASGLLCEPNNAPSSSQVNILHNSKVLQSVDLIKARMTSIHCGHTRAEIVCAIAKRPRQKIFVALLPAMLGKRFPQIFPNVGYVHQVPRLSSLSFFLRTRLQVVKRDQSKERGGVR